MTVRSLIRTVRRALQTIRNPTRGILRVVRRQMARGLGRMGESFRSASDALIAAELYEPEAEARSDLLEMLSDEGKRKLVEGWDPSEAIPTGLMTEGLIKERRKYFAVFKMQVKYRGTDLLMEKYVSGYFNDLQSSDEWNQALMEALENEQYPFAYEHISHTLVAVRHQKGAAY